MSVDEIPRPAEVPSVEELLKRLDAACPRELLANETRRVIERARARMRRGETVEVGTIPAEILRSLATLERPSLRHVINATGIILHPRLGRAPLPPGIDGGYSNLDFDVTTGRKTRRDVHLRDLVERLTGYPGLPVNNNTAAMWLVLHELAGGGEVVVSRGELIDLGDGVRLPEIIARSGAAIREVGTANRTRIEDYQSAIGEHTKLILRVHASNFQLSGFSGRPDTAAISEVARKAELPLYSNLGSGSLIDLQPWGVREPVVADELENGAHLVSFSADKLTGGPQAGIITGDPGLINRLRRNPMLRALQCDKLTCAALETTLRSILFCRFEDVPGRYR